MGSRTSVGTSVSRVIDDSGMPDSIKMGVTTSLFQDVDLVDSVLEELVGSIGVRAERMYAYGRDHYTHGLPSGQFMVAAENIDTAVGTVLLSIENVAVGLDYLRHGPPNLLHIGWMKLMELHGYDPATNQLAVLTAAKGTPVYLHDMVVVIPVAKVGVIEAQALELWGIAARAGYTPHRTTGTAETRAMILPTGVYADPVAVAESVRVDYVWETPAGLQQDSFTIPIAGYADVDYFQVRYRVDGVIKYWMYRDGSGLYPTLDALFDHSPTPNGSFFPFVYFRYNATSEISDKTTQAYKTSKKLVKYLGMDYDAVAEGIDTNPDIGSVQQAMLMLAVPANTTNELEERYLWEFFNNLYLASSPSNQYRTEAEAALDSLNGDQAGLRAPGIVIQDTRFKMSLDNNGIYKRRKAGSIGSVGTYDSAIGTHDVLYTYTEVGGESGDVVRTVTEVITSHYYRRQISRGFYDEIQVISLRTNFHIYGDYSSIGDGVSKILLIPLDKTITGEFTIPEREVLYTRSMHFVFNSMVVTHVAWYQSELFQFVMTAVAVYFTVVSFGANSPMVASLVSAGYSTVAAYVIVAAAQIASTLVVSAAFKLFVKEIGLEAAFILVVVAALAGVTDAAMSGSVSGAPFASDLLMLSSNISQAIGAVVRSDMQDLLNQASEFETLVEEQTKVLETARELLENNSFLSPFVILGEKPGDFYNRTVHSGNIGVVGISAISAYVGQALKLPELQDTLGDQT